MLTESERSMLGRLAAHESWAHTENRTARTAPARDALDRKFLAAAGGDPVRAAHLRKAYFARLALKSAESRRRARELNATAEAAEAELDDLGGTSPPDNTQHPRTPREPRPGVDSKAKPAHLSDGGPDAA